MYLRLLLIGALAAGFAFAQEPGGGGGGGGSGRGGSGYAAQPQRVMSSPLELMTIACKLSKDQAKQFTAILDAAGKSAADLRKQVPASREQLEAAAQAGKSPDEIKKLEDAGGLAMAQMTGIEMKAFADLYKLLTPEQRRTGAQGVFNILPGMFLRKNWNEN
jgi:Spy/CpxP family protein refolding chaperone